MKVSIRYLLSRLFNELKVNSNAIFNSVGGKVNKKGRARHFTSPEELERQRREDQRNWRVINAVAFFITHI